MNIKKILLSFFIILLILPVYEGKAQTKEVKVIDVETGDVIKTVPSTAFFTNELTAAITSMKGITVKVNPLPKKRILDLSSATNFIESEKQMV